MNEIQLDRQKREEGAIGGKCARAEFLNTKSGEEKQGLTIFSTEM
jgi:hypothetical protein